MKIVKLGCGAEEVFNKEVGACVPKFPKDGDEVHGGDGALWEFRDSIWTRLPPYAQKTQLGVIVYLNQTTGTWEPASRPPPTNTRKGPIVTHVEMPRDLL
jgi:hypothetical protein